MFLVNIIFCNWGTLRKIKVCYSTKAKLYETIYRQLYIFLHKKSCFFMQTTVALATKQETNNCWFILFFSFSFLFLFYLFIYYWLTVHCISDVLYLYRSWAFAFIFSDCRYFQTTWMRQFYTWSPCE